jgi:hypothetical protein
MNYLLSVYQTCGGCDCADYLHNKGYFLNETFTTTTTTTPTPDNRTYPPYDVVDHQGSSVIDKPETVRSVAYDSCGIQIYSGTVICLFYHTSEL